MTSLIENVAEHTMEIAARASVRTHDSAPPLLLLSVIPQDTNYLIATINNILAQAKPDARANIVIGWNKSETPKTILDYMLEHQIPYQHLNHKFQKKEEFTASKQSIRLISIDQNPVTDTNVGKTVTLARIAKQILAGNLDVEIPRRMIMMDAESQTEANQSILDLPVGNHSDNFTRAKYIHAAYLNYVPNLDIPISLFNERNNVRSQYDNSIEGSGYAGDTVLISSILQSLAEFDLAHIGEDLAIQMIGQHLGKSVESNSSITIHNRVPPIWDRLAISSQVGRWKNNQKQYDLTFCINTHDSTTNTNKVKSIQNIMIALLSMTVKSIKFAKQDTRAITGLAEEYTSLFRKLGKKLRISKNISEDHNLTHLSGSWER